MEDWDVFWGDDSLPRCAAEHQGTSVRHTLSLPSLPLFHILLLSPPSLPPSPSLSPPAPEVLMGGEGSIAADMWALGATLFIL